MFVARFAARNSPLVQAKNKTQFQPRPSYFSSTTPKSTNAPCSTGASTIAPQNGAAQNPAQNLASKPNEPVVENQNIISSLFKSEERCPYKEGGKDGYN